MLDRLATRVADAMGSTPAIIAAFAFVLVWGLSGPLFGYSDTWQLIINTGTTVATFLAVFFIQRTQNQDTCEVKASLQAIIDAMNLEAERDARMEEGEGGP